MIKLSLETLYLVYTDLLSADWVTESPFCKELVRIRLQLHVSQDYIVWHRWYRIWKSQQQRKPCRPFMVFKVANELIRLQHIYWNKMSCIYYDNGDPQRAWHWSVVRFVIATRKCYSRCASCQIIIGVSRPIHTSRVHGSWTRLV